MRFLPNQRDNEEPKGRRETVISFAIGLIRPHPFQLYGYTQ